MIVKGLILNVATNAELTASTGLVNNQFAWHTTDNQLYIYEAKFGSGDVSSIEGGYWLKDSIESLDLAGYKAYRFKEIDIRTGELVANGFGYQGLVFSLSQNAQINILGMDTTRNDPAITYPIEYSTIDDLGHYSVVDATDLHNMYLTALGTKKYFVDTGTTLKDAVRAATTDSEVQSIIDNR